MTSLLVQALAALFVTAMLSRKLNGSVVGGATAFWISWVMLFAAALASSALGVQTEPPEIALTYAQEGVVGAVLGSLLGVWLAGNARAALSGSQRWSEFAQVCEYILCRFTRPVVVVMLICGVAHFAQQWERIDYDIFRLLEMREAVLNERDHGVLYRVTSYMQLLTGFMAMLAGTADAEYGVRARRLALMWLSLAIPGLALGGRGWTLAPQMIYLFAHVISRQCASKRRPGIRAYFPVMALIAAGFWAFTVIGTVRNRNLNRDQAEMLEVSNWDLEQKMMAVSYLGGSLSALGTIGKAAEQIGPSYGEATFDYFSRKATAFNWPYGEKAAQLERWRTSDMPSESEFGWT